ncbi:MAG TPA: hypothetical protein VFF70_03430 [Anaerolineae bacterium]|nr:hypothetical protein [Anaerolineae bacterium]
MEIEGERTLRQAGTAGDIAFIRSVDARFIGQGSETNLPISEHGFTQIDPIEIRRRFDQVYARLYGRTYPESPIEFVNFRVRASLPVRLLELPRLAVRSDRRQTAVKGQRQAFSGIAHEFIPFTVYDRYQLAPGASFAGPAIIEERESTVIIGEDATASIDEFGFLWIEMQERSNVSTFQRSRTFANAKI